MANFRQLAKGRASRVRSRIHCLARSEVHASAFLPLAGNRQTVSCCPEREVRCWCFREKKCVRHRALPAKRVATTADRHFRRVFRPVHPRRRCEYPQPRNSCTDSPRERARPGSSGNHDDTAPMFPNPVTAPETMPPAVSNPLTVHTSGSAAPSFRAMLARAGAASDGSARPTEGESRPGASPVPVHLSTLIVSPAVLHRYVIPVRRNAASIP